VLEETLRAAWAVGAGILAPGALVVRAAGLGRGALERAVLAVAFGILLLAGATLVATSTGLAGAMPAWGVLALAAHAALRLSGRGPGAEAPAQRAAWPSVVAALIPVAAAALLVFAVSARNGVVDADGALVARGKDVSGDSLVYMAIARDLAETGLPLANPFTSDSPIPGHLGFFGLLAGVHLVGGGDWLDVLFRVLPLLTVTSLALAAFALVRALGGSAGGASIGATLVVLGADLSWPARQLATMLGVPAQDPYAWAFFSPYFLPFNPGGAGLLLTFAALLLLARTPAGGTRSAVATGLLTVGIGLFKVSLWPPFIAGLVLVALRPAPAHARWLRVAAAVAVVGSLPVHLDVMRVMASPEAEYMKGGIGACVGCLPRFFVDLTFRGHPWSFDAFEEFRLAGLLSVREWLAIAGATALFLVVALGARLLALPELVRGCRFGAADASGRAVAHRVLLVAVVVGVLLACTVGIAPHYQNVAQFSWSAAFGLWIVLGVAAGRWLAERRWLWLAVVLVLSLSSSWRWIHDHAWAAPVIGRVSAEERALLDQLAAVSQPGDLVLEPSWLDDTLSAVPPLAGRPVYLSLSSTAMGELPVWDQLFRAGKVHHVFQGGRREAALAALRATKARFVYAPAARPLPVDLGEVLEVVARNPAGTVYRARPA
jgi:hypothetical protein